MIPMDFLKKEAALKIIGVYRITHSCSSWTTPKRGFAVLSCRTDGETLFRKDGTELTVRKGDILYIPANISYSQVSNGEQLVAIHFCAENCSDTEIEVIKSAELPGSAETFVNIFRKWDGENAAARYAATAMIYKLISKISEYRTEKTSSRIAGGIEYIKQNYKNCDLTVGDAAKAACVSEVFFRRLMNRDYGTSPVKYINNLRISSAKELLDCGYYSVAEVAEMCGFSELKYFSYVFRQITGMTATQYRKRSG